MDSIKDIIVSIISNLEKGEQKTGKKISVVWERVVPEVIKTHTKPYKFQKNILFVRVDDATWAYELNQKYKEEIIKRLNNEVGEGKIQQIRFKIGDIG